MKFGFGLITCQRYPGNSQSDLDLHVEALQLAEEAERLGFDSVWVAEHHFMVDSWMPSPLVVSAAMAARTSRIEIGTGVVIAPFYNPLRLAEDAATVDLLSNGRLLLGLGLGWRDQEFNALGVEKRGLGTRLEGTIGTLRQAWGDGLVTVDVPAPGVTVTPHPARAGGPPIWIGAGAERAVRRAGRLADGFLGGGSPEVFAHEVAWIHEELERAGRDPAAFAFSVTVPLFAWSEGDAWTIIRDHLHYLTWNYEELGAGRARVANQSPPSLTAEHEERLRAGSLVGRPEHVADTIRSYAETAGPDLHFVARLYWPGLERDIQVEAMRVFAEEVVPLLI